MSYENKNDVGEFLKHSNWVPIGTVLIACVLCFGRVNDHDRRVESLEKNGSPYLREKVQAVETRLDFTEKRTQAIEADAKQTAVVISEFRSDLRLVVEWVKDQKRKDSKP